MSVGFWTFSVFGGGMVVVVVVVVVVVLGLFHSSYGSMLMPCLHRLGHEYGWREVHGQNFAQHANVM